MGRETVSRLELLIRKSISEFFLQSKRDEIPNSLACEIPPEIMKEVMELLVAPVMVAILADVIIQRLPSNKSTDLRRQAEEMRMQAQEQMRNRMRRLGKGPRQAKILFDYISGDSHVRIEMTQLDSDPEKILDAIKGLIEASQHEK